MVVPRNFHLLVAATLVCGLLMISYVSRTVHQSRTAMLTVSGVEKIQHLDNQISNRLANEELAKWDKLEAKKFPSEAHSQIVKNLEGNLKSLLINNFMRVLIIYVRPLDAQKNNGGKLI